MRRVIWYGAMLALVCGAVVYLTVDYACRYPDSVIGQCLIGGCRAGAAADQVGRVSEATVERTFEAIQEVMKHPEMAPSTVTVAPPDPEPAEVEEPICPPAKPKIVPDGVVTDRPERIVIQPEVEERAPSTPAAGAAEEAEDPPPMPPARSEGPVPDKMPYAVDRSGANERMLELFRELLQGGATDCTDPEEEECLPPPPDPPNCREDPNYDRHYPGCPYTGPAVESKGKLHRMETGSEEQGTPPATLPGIPKGGPEARNVKHRTIDTTEYRPSDGIPFDFGSFPY
jgi:hypothetical protein